MQIMITRITNQVKEIYADLVTLWFSFIDVVKDTVSNLTPLLFKLKLPHLWSEAAIIKRIIYKNGNQHRMQFYFQGLRRVLSLLIDLFILFSLLPHFRPCDAP